MQLSQQAIQELLGSEDKLTEFSTTALIHAITAGVMRVQDPKTAPSSVSQFIESLRKVRADLTGKNHELNVPQMMVNIQFGKSEQPQLVTLDHDTGKPIADNAQAAQKSETPKKALSKLDNDLLEATNALFAESNLSDD